MEDQYWEERGIAYRTNRFDHSRETLVFIHGLGTGCSGWASFETALESKYNILTYDLRGHGHSLRYKHYDDYAPEKLADDLIALVQVLKIRSCSLISTSFGTLIALLFLRRYPGMVQTNLLLAPVYKNQPLTVGAEKPKPPLLAKMPSLMPFSRSHGRRMDYSRFEYAEDLQWGRIVHEIRNMSLRIYLFYLYHLNGFTDYGWWSQIEVPTTILHGTKDSFSPYHSAVELSKVIPNARLVPLDGGNHIVTINNRNEILAQLAKG
jgi:pimeloyl-ACP methyl ester carboxylesterase